MNTMSYLQNTIKNILVEKLLKYKLTNPIEFMSIAPHIVTMNPNQIYTITFSTSEYIFTVHFPLEGNISINIKPYRMMCDNIYRYCKMEQYCIYFELYQRGFEENHELLRLLEDIFKLKRVKIFNKTYFELSKQ